MKRLLLPALLLTTLTACTATPAGTLPAAAPTPSAARSMPEESAQSGRPSVCRRVNSGAAAMLRLHVTNEGINKMGLSMP